MSKKRDGDLREILAEARAIYLAMAHGTLTCQQAKDRTAPHLKKINAFIGRIAKEYHQEPKYIKFSDLGINI